MTVLVARGAWGASWVGPTPTATDYRDTVLATPGLRAYWRLGETGGTLAYDASGNSAPATYVGGVTLNRAGVLSPADDDPAVSLDGSSGYIQAPAAVWFAGDFTVEGWVNPTSLPANCRLLDFGAGTSNNVLVAVAGGDTHPFLDVNASFLSAPSALPTGVWSYLVATVAGTTARLYVNGAVVASGTVNVPANVTRANCYLGKSNFAGDALLPGTLDEVAIYTRALAASEVAAHYAARLTPPPAAASAPALLGTDLRFAVFVGGVQTDSFEAHITHAVDRPVAVCTLVMPAPLPAQVQLLQPVVVMAGFDDHTSVVFNGRIPEDDVAIDENGFTATITCDGWAGLLAIEDYQDIAFAGPISLTDVFRGLCKQRSVPSYFAEKAVYPDGVTTVMLGGNADIKGGQVIVPRTESPLSWLQRTCELFGYRVFDTPGGAVTMQRVSGTPTASPVLTMQEGVNAYRFARARDSRQVFTVWEVQGASWTDSSKVQHAIRSLPASPPANAYVSPPGYARKQISDDVLITQGLADAVRNVHEIDFATPRNVVTWECDGLPDRAPGDVVQTVSTTVGDNSARWLLELDQSISVQGYYATMSGWAGGGSPLAALNDCTTQTLLGEAGVHLGDETIAWYKNHAPTGTSWSATFTVASAYTSLSLAYDAHGTNDYFIGGQNSASTVSVVQLWQSGTKLSETQLSVLNENYAKRLDYTNDANWTHVALGLGGNLVAGSATITFVSGSDARATLGPFDDFEIKNVVVQTCGVGTPTLPAPALTYPIYSPQA